MFVSFDQFLEQVSQPAHYDSAKKKRNFCFPVSYHSPDDAKKKETKSTPLLKWCGSIAVEL
jgi:hypothetical protein